MTLVYIGHGQVKVSDLLAASIVGMIHGDFELQRILPPQGQRVFRDNVYYIGVGNTNNPEKNQFDTQTFGFHETYPDSKIRLGTGALLWQAMGKKVLETMHIDDNDDYVYEKVFKNFIQPLECTTTNLKPTSLNHYLSMFETFEEAFIVVNAIFTQYMHTIKKTCNAYAAELEELHEAFFERSQPEILILKTPSSSVNTFLSENDAYNEVQFVIEPCKNDGDGPNFGAYSVTPVPRNQHIPLISNRMARDYLLSRLKSTSNDRIVVYDLTAAIWVAKSSLHVYYAPINLAHRFYTWAVNLTF
jgi:uncharacterized UPF0160 family protein